MPGSAIFIRLFFLSLGFKISGPRGPPKEYHGGSLRYGGHPRLLATDGPFNPCAPAGWATLVGICPDIC